MLRQLANIFTSHTPIPTSIKGTVRGTIPTWLRGNFLFSSPALFDIPPSPAPSSPPTPFTVNHFGDGYALLGNFHIHDPNNVTFHTKFLQSDAYTKAIAAGRTVLPEYATPSWTDPNEKKMGGGLLAILQGKTKPTSDNGNHAIFRLGDNLYASNGQAYFTLISPLDLETSTKMEARKLYGLSSFSAHPQQDEDGVIWNIGAAVGATGASTKFIKLPEAANGNLEKYKVVASIPPISSSHVSSLHTFGLTPNHLLFIDTPATLNFKTLIKTQMSGEDSAILDLVEWLPEHKNRFHIVNKETGQLVTSKTVIQANEPFFFHHIVNCYEDTDEIHGHHLVVDLHAYPNMNPALGLTVENMRNDTPVCKPEEEGALQRFKVPVELGKESPLNLTPQPLSEKGLSSLNINLKFKGKKYRYCYGHGSLTRGVYQNTAIKFDLEAEGAELKWNGGEHAYLTELTFVENGEARGEGAEDDGILIGGVCDLREGAPHYLILLSAKDMTEIARVEFETAIPVYPHGIFVPKQ